MVKKSVRRRKFRRYLKGVINVENDFGGMAAKAINSTDMPDVVLEKTWCSSIVATWTLSNWTPTALAGPILFGVAHSDYTNAEMEEFIENVESWNEGNLVQQEVAKRKIRIIGHFAAPESAAHDTVFEHGRKVRTKIGWILQTGTTLQVWVYNTGTMSVATITPSIDGRGHANLWPV